MAKLEVVKGNDVQVQDKDGKKIGDVVDTGEQPKENPNGAERSITDIVKELRGQELIDFLKKVHPSDAHVLIKKFMDHYQIEELQKDKELKTQFKEIEEQAKQSYNMDNAPARMIDVNRAATNVYKMCLALIKGLNDGQIDVKGAINAIEKHLGLSETMWAEEVADGDKQIVTEDKPVVEGDGDADDK